jgi:hypothetical protein
MTQDWVNAEPDQLTFVRVCACGVYVHVACVCVFLIYFHDELNQSGIPKEISNKHPEKIVKLKPNI